MPDFIVLGAVKAGTTSLYHYLGQHPDIRMSTENWPRYFHVESGEPDLEALRARYGDALHAESVWRYKLMCHARVPRTFAAYEAMWPSRTGTRPLLGEVSPTYLHDPDVPDRIARRLPDVRLVVVLRHPADRAYSHYVMDAARGWVPEKTFAEALQREPRDIDSFWWGSRHYFRHGLYADRIAHLKATFPPERLLIKIHDDYVADAQAFVRDIFAFLGADPAFPVDVRQRHNVGWVARTGASGQTERVKAPPLAPEFRHALARRYKSDIRRLQDLLRRDLSHWLR